MVVFYEIELKRVVSHYGNMAQVWSAFEIRTDTAILSDNRGLNMIKYGYLQVKKKRNR